MATKHQVGGSLLLDKENRIIQPKDKTIRRKKTFKRFLFFSLWFYFISRVFITDIEIFIIAKYTSFNPFLYAFYRLIFLSLVSIAVWLKVGNKKFWKNIGLLLIFPIYPGTTIIIKKMLYDVPKFFVRKKWNSSLYSYLNLILKFFFNFKFIVGKGLLFLLAITFLYTSNFILLSISGTIFLCLQILHIRKRYKETFKPMKIFQINLDSLLVDVDENLAKEHLEKHILKTIKEQEKKEESNQGEENIEKKKGVFNEMESLLMMNEFALAFNGKMKDILNNRTYLKSAILKVLFSFLISMLYFGGINYCIYLYDSSNFKVEFIPTFFDFFYYSFFTIIPDGTDIEPVSQFAKIIRMLGVLVGVIINLLILAVYLTVVSDKYKENLGKAILLSNVYSNEIKNHFKNKYGISPKEGIEKMKKIGSKIDTHISEMKNLFFSKK